MSFPRLSYLLFPAVIIAAITFSSPQFLTAQAAKLSGRIVVDRLEQLGYFKYTEPKDILKVRNEMIKAYDKNQYFLIIVYNEDDWTPLDNRLYSCDGENLYEQGGLIAELKEIKRTFDKMKLKLVWANEKVKFVGERGLDHRITLNGKEYIAYKEDYSYLSWGLATKHFVEMINDQLKIQGSDERLYPISGGNDGRIIFLTEDQFKYIRQVCVDNSKDQDWLPKTLKEWWVY